MCVRVCSCMCMCAFPFFKGLECRVGSEPGYVRETEGNTRLRRLEWIQIVLSHVSREDLRVRGGSSPRQCPDPAKEKASPSSLMQA